MRKVRCMFRTLIVVFVLISFGWVFAQEREVRRLLSVPSSNAACFPPCWAGIIPGETSAVDGLKIIATLPTRNIRGFRETRRNRVTFDELKKMVQKGDSRGIIEMDWKTFPWLGECVNCYTIEWDKGKIVGIRMYVSWQVGDIIRTFGSPEGIIVVPGGVPEHWYWHVNILYPGRGLSLGAITAEYEHEFSPASKVISFYYTMPWNEEKILPWRGFGNIPELYGIP